MAPQRATYKQGVLRSTARWPSPSEGRTAAAGHFQTTDVEIQFRDEHGTLQT